MKSSSFETLQLCEQKIFVQVVFQKNCTLASELTTLIWTPARICVKICGCHYLWTNWSFQDTEKAHRKALSDATNFTICLFPRTDWYDFDAHRLLQPTVYQTKMKNVRENLSLKVLCKQKDKFSEKGEEQNQWLFHSASESISKCFFETVY